MIQLNNESDCISLLIGIQNVQMEMMNMIQNLNRNVSIIQHEMMSKKETLTLSNLIEDKRELSNSDDDSSRSSTKDNCSISVISYDNDTKVSEITGYRRSSLLSTFSEMTEDGARRGSFLSIANPLKSRHFQNFVKLVDCVLSHEDSEEEKKESTMCSFAGSYKDLISAHCSISKSVGKYNTLGFAPDYMNNSKSHLPNPLENKEKAFTSFAFLSADRLCLSAQNVKCWGKNALSPIILSTGSIMDQYPTNNNISFDGLDTFCFPKGLSIRIIPKCAVDGAKRLGWFGRKADRYQLHAFHDITGMPTWGVSITVREIVNLPRHVIREIKLLRLKRKYVSKIISSWRSHKVCKEEMELDEREKAILTKSVKKWGRQLSERYLGDIEEDVELEIGRRRRRHSETIRTGTELISDNNKEQGKKVKYSAKVSQLAAESYEQMIENFEEEDVCIVEKCYCLLGTKPEHNGLLLSALQNLVSFEEPSKQRFIFGNKISSTKFLCNRHSILEEFQSKLCPSFEADTIPEKNIRKHEVTVFDLDFPFRSMVYSLPLPQVTDWGAAQLLLRLKFPILLNVLMLLLLERSVLIIGENSEDVSSCALALLDLLKPYKWSSVFLPSLSDDMIDFISSPVPFIAAMVGKDEEALKRIKMDHRVKEERKNGLTIIDITDCTVLWTEETEIRKNMFARIRNLMQHWYRHNEQFHYQQKLEELNSNEDSSLHSLKSFVKEGFSSEELTTISSIKESIAGFFAHFAGSISKYNDGWKDFTSKDKATNEINFSEEKFYSPTMHLFEFQKLFSKTQLIASYFEEKRILNTNEEFHAARFIADWVYFNRWRNNKIYS